MFWFQSCGEWNILCHAGGGGLSNNEWMMKPARRFAISITLISTQFLHL
jgi:hypothetical protein